MSRATENPTSKVHPSEATRPLSDLGQDLHFALRTLRSAPGFAIAAILTLAIGIGANTAIFSAVDGVLLKPLPYSRAEQIVRIYQNDRAKNKPRDDVAPGNFAQWRARATSFAAMAAVEPYGLIYSGPEGEEQIRNWNVTEDFFRVLDARPAAGRLFLPEDYRPGAPAVLVLTYESWQKRFGGESGVIGRTITIGHAPATIVGVLPRDFAYLGARTPQEMYAPKVLDSLERDLRGSAWYHVVARLRPNATIGQASADLERVSSQLAREYPGTNAKIGVSLVSLREGMVGGSARLLWLLLGAVGLVLLIACVNVANLVLARTHRRSREFAVRVALGAGRGRVARQVLAESFVIALIGGVAGAALAYWGVGVIRGLSPISIPRVDEMRVDVRALVFALAAILLTTFLFGVVPALRASDRGSDELKSGTRAGGGMRHRRLRESLVAAEIALAVVLLTGAGLLLRSFVSVLSQDRGYRTDHVVGATMFAWQWTPTPEARARFAAQLVERAKAIPGVSAAGVTSSPPLTAAIGVDHGTYGVVGRIVPRGSEPSAHLTSITPGAFDALRISVRRGRVFSLRDDASSLPVAVINETFARRNWPNENPLGKRIRVGFYGAPLEREVVGVVGDTPTFVLDAPADPTIYLPNAQAPTGGIWLVLATSTDPTVFGREIKRLVAEINPALPIAGIQTFDSIMDDSLRPRRFSLVLLGCFSVVALALAVIGVYGVISQGLAERSRELAIRMALGAQASDVVRLVLGESFKAAGLGLVAGLVISIMATRLLTSLLFGVGVLDPVTFSSVSALMLMAALAASYVPARRATKTDPVAALRIG
ncbi:MAG TPA: ABC transporter permease [Gemmatimonadaceae bacterium]|nr:ABC transporter permease [Gemmatimonadaceae bacterium]